MTRWKRLISWAAAKPEEGRTTWTQEMIVYVSRDPKDAALSFYHHYKLMNGYKGSVEDYLEAFMNDALVYSPFWGHILDFWKLRHEPNVLFNTYEEMKQNLMRCDF
ncbi:Sulfotransferase [Gryllus bimaculatus]|nr:Sulfotransferase [Gryllus bimaculatus]